MVLLRSCNKQRPELSDACYMQTGMAPCLSPTFWAEMTATGVNTWRATRQMTWKKQEHANMCQVSLEVVCYRAAAEGVCSLPMINLIPLAAVPGGSGIISQNLAYRLALLQLAFAGGINSSSKMGLKIPTGMTSPAPLPSGHVVDARRQTSGKQLLVLKGEFFGICIVSPTITGTRANLCPHSHRQGRGLVRC